MLGKTPSGYATPVPQALPQVARSCSVWGNHPETMVRNDATGLASSLKPGFAHVLDRNLGNPIGRAAVAGSIVGNDHSVPRLAESSE